MSNVMMETLMLMMDVMNCVRLRLVGSVNILVKNVCVLVTIGIMMEFVVNVMFHVEVVLVH